MYSARFDGKGHTSWVDLQRSSFIRAPDVGGVGLGSHNGVDNTQYFCGASTASSGFAGWRAAPGRKPPSHTICKPGLKLSWHPRQTLLYNVPEVRSIREVRRKFVPAEEAYDTVRPKGSRATSIKPRACTRQLESRGNTFSASG